MATKHKTQSASALAPVAGEIGAADWNDDHEHVPFEVVMFAEASAAQVFTNLGTGPTELAPPKMRNALDLTFADSCRLVLCQAAVGAAGSGARVQYSTDQSTWAYLNAAGEGPFAEFSTTTNQVVRGAWVTIDASAMSDVFLRLVATGGNGTADPSLWSAYLQVK